MRMIEVKRVKIQTVIYMYCHYYQYLYEFDCSVLFSYTRILCLELKKNIYLP